MKSFFLSIILLSAFSFNSCSKEDFMKCGKGKDGWNYQGICKDPNLSEFENDAIFQKYIVEPLITDETCNCIVSGMVKYVHIEKNQTAAIIKYGEEKSDEDNCDQWAFKTLCFDGKCEGKKSTTCKFQLDCKTGQ